VKRRKFLSHLKKQGCQLIREGGKHSWWGNRETRARSAVPRHIEISDILCRKICKDLGIADP
jgi:mRNA interferase HicA